MLASSSGLSICSRLLPKSNKPGSEASGNEEPVLPHVFTREDGHDGRGWKVRESYNERRGPAQTNVADEEHASADAILHERNAIVSNSEQVAKRFVRGVCASTHLPSPLLV